MVRTELSTVLHRLCVGMVLTELSTVLVCEGVVLTELSAVLVCEGVVWTELCTVLVCEGVSCTEPSAVLHIHVVKVRFGLNYDSKGLHREAVKLITNF